MSRADPSIENPSYSLGTGFLWNENNRCYLITNWHNISGVNPDTDKMLSNFIPNVLTIEFKKLIERTEGGRIVGSEFININLYLDGAPIWLEHELRQGVDCVAIPLDLKILEASENKAINCIDFQTDLLPEIGMDCFVVGYPKGLAGRGATPIWKRASIATEPAFDHDNKPLILVDTATRQGMSGSPVIVRHSGIHSPNREFDGSTVIGTVENLFGIYSGRVGDDEFGVQLGRVWKLSVVQDIIGNGVIGQDPMQAK